MNANREYFKRCRKAKGTQQKVASDNNVSAIYIRKIESGEFTPGRDLMFALSKYFDETPEKLFPDYFSSLGLLSDAKTDN